MRSPRHYLKKHYGEWRIAGRRRELEREIGEGLGKPLTLSLYGDGGNDSIYLARTATENVAVVRLDNPYKGGFLRWRTLRAALRSKTKNRSIANQDRYVALNREWEQYEQLADSGVTPRPLWRTTDATVVSCLPGRRMHRLLAGLPPAEWGPWMDTAFGALARFHEFDMAHLDAKASNIILDEASHAAFFIDLGRFGDCYGSLAQQKTFDYLKLLSSLLQIAPGRMLQDGKPWLSAVAPHVPPEVRQADKRPLMKQRSIRHLERCHLVRRALAPVLPGIES